MKKRKKYVKYILIILLILICIILSLIYQDKDVANVEKKLLYKNIGINNNELNVLYLNVGQADATLITMGTDVMLIDAGDKSDGKYIVEFLKAQGIEKIDYLIETHSDDDHSGGIKTIVKNLDVNNVYMPQSAIQKSEIKDDIGINVFSNLEQIYTLGNATWKVLSVDNSEEVNENGDNDTSIVIQLTYENTKFLFMGDATDKVEKQLLNENKLQKIDVLKVGHHGSSSSSSEKFINALLPTYSVISVNNLEYSKHPSDSTIQRLERMHSQIYRTDKDGTIWITSDGTNIKIEKLDINVNGTNRSAKLVENRKYSLFFIATHYHFDQQPYKHYLLIEDNSYNEFLLE